MAARAESAAGAQATEEDMMSDLGIGVVGCGLIGTRHGILFDSLDGASLACGIHAPLEAVFGV